MELLPRELRKGNTIIVHSLASLQLDMTSQKKLVHSPEAPVFQTVAQETPPELLVYRPIKLQLWSHRTLNFGMLWKELPKDLAFNQPETRG